MSADDVPGLHEVKALRRSMRRTSIRTVTTFSAGDTCTLPSPTESGQHDGDSVPQLLPEALELSGFWVVLPDEILDVILEQCSNKQLGMLQTTCSYFLNTPAMETLARQRLKEIPRARGLLPSKRLKESFLKLLHFIDCQSNAAAQSTAVACGAYHVAALLVPTSSASTSCTAGMHALHTFGRGMHGQLGNGTFVDVNRPTAISLGFKPSTSTLDAPGEVEEETMAAVVACGSSHTAAISRRGELYTWGLGMSGETGLGQWTPLEACTPTLVALPSAVRIVSVALGSHHTLAITEQGQLYSFGRGFHGQLGVGHMLNTLTPLPVTALSEHRIVSAAAGASHSMALASDGSLFTWGDGRYGQLGLTSMQALAIIPHQAMVVLLPFKIARLDPANINPEDRITAVAAGANHSVALTVSGAILTFGRNELGALGTGDCEDRYRPTKVVLCHATDKGQPLRARRAVQVACGIGHTLALVSSNGINEAWSTGCNSWGQLGTGDRKHSAFFIPVSPHISGIVSVQAGDDHSAAVTNQGSLYVWGRGDCGQLGIGDERSKWRPTLLADAEVVHPDRTLRRLRRIKPRTRPVPAAVRRQQNGCDIHCQ